MVQGLRSALKCHKLTYLHCHSCTQIQIINNNNMFLLRVGVADLEESVLFNSDSLFKIASYLPADGLLNLALTCRRFGIAPLPDSKGDSSLSLVEETACRVVNDIATEEEKNALPGYDEDNWLCKYNYLQSLRVPLTFDQLAESIVYVEGNKSCVVNNSNSTLAWVTAFSNNIMMAGKHYVLFEADQESGLLLGVMRPGPGEVKTNIQYTPLSPYFYQHFNQREGSLPYNNNVNCCMYSSVQCIQWGLLLLTRLGRRHL